MQTSVIIETYAFARLLLHQATLFCSQGKRPQRISLANLQFIRRKRICVKKCVFLGVIFIGQAILA